MLVVVVFTTFEWGWQIPKIDESGGCNRHMVRVAMKVKQLIGTHGGPYEGVEAPKSPPPQLKMAKNDYKGDKIKKLNRINNQGQIFSRFYTQVIDFRVKVHMRTLGLEVGQKWAEMGPM